MTRGLQVHPGIVIARVVPKSYDFLGMFQNPANKADYAGDHDSIDLTNSGAITLNATSHALISVFGIRASGSPNASPTLTTGLGSVTAVQNGSGDFAKALAADASISQMFIQKVGATSNLDLDIVFPETQGRIGFAIHILHGSDISTTAFDADGSVADPGTKTLSTTFDGFCIGYGATNDNGTMTWTALTEESGSDETIEGVSSHSAASASTDGSDITPQCDYTGSNANRGAVFATF